MDRTNFSSMGRRRFMENLAGVGVSASTLSHLTQEDFDNIVDDVDDEIPYVAYIENKSKEPGEAPEREPIYKTVPRERWERQQTSLDAAARTNEIIEDELEDSSIDALLTTMDSPTEYGVKVRVPQEASPRSVEEVETLLPTEMEGYTDEDNPSKREGIPITVEESKEDLFCDYNYVDLSGIPGGHPINGGAGQGTITGSFHSNTYGDGLVSAGHVLGTNNQIVQEITEKKDDGELITDLIGRARDISIQNDNNIDCGYIEPNSDHSASSAISGPQNQSTDYSINGIVTDWEIYNNFLGNSNYEVKLQGQKSCRKSGQVTGVKPNTGSPNDIEAVVAGPLMGDGDSGGPIFYTTSSNDAYLVGNIVGGAGVFETKGTTAETIEETLEGDFF